MQDQRPWLTLDRIAGAGRLHTIRVTRPPDRGRRGNQRRCPRTWKTRITIKRIMLFSLGCNFFFQEYRPIQLPLTQLCQIVLLLKPQMALFLVTNLKLEMSKRYTRSKPCLYSNINTTPSLNPINKRTDRALYLRMKGAEWRWISSVVATHHRTASDPSPDQPPEWNQLTTVWRRKYSCLYIIYAFYHI